MSDSARTAAVGQTERMVQVPEHVDGIVYGEAGDFGTWFFEDRRDLVVDRIEAKGGRVLYAEPPCNR